MAVTGWSGVWVLPQEAVPSVCVLVLLGTTTPFWLVLVTSKDCLRFKRWFLRSRLELGLGG